MSRRLNIFLACAHMGLRHALADKFMILGSFLIYAVIMVLYAGVIKMIPPADIVSTNLTHAQMIWYLGTTEMILFTGAAWAYKEVQAAFHSQQAHLLLIRPASYAFVRFSFWTGESVVRVLIYVPLYFVFMWVLSGEIVLTRLGLLGVLISIPLGTVLMNCASYMIGASCLWLRQSDPVFWIWQKCIFLLGAMLWPLVFYPDWLQNIVWFLPFHGMLAQGANWTLDLPMQTYAQGFLNQFVWALIFLWALRCFDRRVLKRIQNREG